MSIRLPLAVALLGCALCAAPAGVGQAAGVNQGGPGYVHAQAGSDPISQNKASPSSMDQMPQAEQRRRIAADTAKLVELSNQLKAEVDRSPKDQLSVEVMRKASEIEKTARDLKGWMSY